jgi:histidyl-tRNA synthetase
MTDTAKGFQDFTGEEALKREKIREILIKNFKRYGFEPAETPIIEYEEFVKGDNEFDEAVSDIFKLKDRGERNLALRYEFTFQLKRLANNKKLPYKRYQIGEVFRDEPTSSNRFRQFTQCDIDTIGSSVKDEAEILTLISKIYKELGIKSRIKVNNRKLLNSVIKSLGIENTEFVLREIDKLDKQGEDFVKLSLAKFIDKDKIIKLFKILRKNLNFFKKFEGYKELKELIELCKIYKIKIDFQPTLARGLSYYNGNVFEIKTEGVKETIAGGGSYSINNIQSTGISFSLERVSQLSKINLNEKKILIISIGQDKKAVNLAEKIRKQSLSCSIFYGQPSKALDYANSLNIPYVIFLGKDEVKKKKIKLKDMKTGKEKLISEKELIENY